MASLGLVLLLLWTTIHGVNYFARPRKSEFLLPTSRGLALARRRNHFWDTRTTQVVLTKLHLRVQTSAWNTQHDSLARAVSSRPRASLRAALTYFYNVGCAMGLLGTLLSLGLLLWTCGNALVPLARAALLSLSPSLQSSPALLLKRGLDSAVEEAAARSTMIKPLIPGVTVPLNHLPAILLAVFLSQIIHELGHAVSAALDAVPIMTAGASFTVVVPAAFVTFPATALEALKPFARSRIIAAGPFHNLVFWCFLLLVGRIGAGDFLTHMLYRDVSNVGRVVVGIDGDSDLRGYLPVGSLITKLDDAPLQSAADQWTAYLTSTSPSAPGLGWCVDRAGYLESPQSCCDPHAPFSPLTCFVAVSSPDKGCLDAIPILTGAEEQRCSTDVDCYDAAQCVRPDEAAHILRLTVHADGQDSVILWSGPLLEVHEQVEVGILLPRFRLVPLWLHRSTRLFWDYLKMATLSLYLFNLLPLPYLDGAQFVRALLDMTFEADTGYDEYDMEALEAAATADQGVRRNRGRWKERLGKGIPVATTCLFVLSTLLALANIQ
ncbi:hypothetical protein B0H17DRAFT_1037545 [Mycena rosella]|uniref:Endopeptidase S2P n=1 Tax=Mycena rosella TaxID=1033263 RepID=A0AAD7GTZ9_MYCRO|nr:hypothetical protein B0H17DRAFT_1037545 [Mycena rosella]